MQVTLRSGRRLSVLTCLSVTVDVSSSKCRMGHSAIHGNRWRFTILGAYKRRWAPYVQAHGPGQGQLPLDRVWPQGLWFLSGSAERIGDIGRFAPPRQWPKAVSFNLTAPVGPSALPPACRGASSDRRASRSAPARCSGDVPSPRPGPISTPPPLFREP